MNSSDREHGSGAGRAVSQQPARSMPEPPSSSSGALMASACSLRNPETANTPSWRATAPWASNGRSPALASALVRLARRGAARRGSPKRAGLPTPATQSKRAGCAHGKHHRP